MAKSVNKVILLGHLGKDAETKYTPSGTARTTFTLATNRRVKDGQTGEWKDETDWHNIVVWQSESIANYLLKGKQVYLEGRLSSRSYDDKDGNKRYITEVVAQAGDIILLSGGARGEGAGAGDFGGGQPVSMPRAARREPEPASGGFDPGVTDDDVPF